VQDGRPEYDTAGESPERKSMTQDEVNRRGVVTSFSFLESGYFCTNGIIRNVSD
jgi:hypothetical protein